MRRIGSIFGLSFALALAAVPALAQAPAAHELTKADVDTWLDGFLPYAIERGDVPGAVVVVVKGGQVLTARGFGYSDVAAHKPVDPALTLFRPGSISKLFTWTAVMQLVEQGKIDLDAPVNTYLDFKLPDWNGKPITMRNIMTHTPGFEDGIRDLIHDGPAPFSLDGILKERILAQVYEPGTTPSYSNYGSAVAGYVVQRLSGEKFEDYIQKHIFEPLQMEHSTFDQPLPDNLKPLMSQGYGPGKRQPYPFETVRLAPAGALSAPGEDMAKFMISHLHHAAGLLKPETADMMHTTMLTLMPQVPRMALGFQEYTVNGHRAVGHGGDSHWFHSRLMLLLDDDVGIYVSCNSPGNAMGASAIRAGLSKGFMDRYFPVAPTEYKSIDAGQAAEHAKLMVGPYISSRRADSTYHRASEFFGQSHVQVDAKDHLVTEQKGANGEKIQWVEIEPFVWANPDGDEKLAAKIANGKVVMWGTGATAEWLPVPFERQSDWIRPATYAALAVLLLTALFQPASALVRRNYGLSQTLAGQDLMAYRAISYFSILGIAVFVVWYWVLREHGGDALTYVGEAGSWIVLPILVAIAVWNAVRVWTGERSTGARLCSAVQVLSTLVLFWTAIIFKLFYIGLV